jgi:hypothetical protein
MFFSSLFRLLHGSDPSGLSKVIDKAFKMFLPISTITFISPDKHRTPLPSDRGIYEGGILGLRLCLFHTFNYGLNVEL